MSICQATQQLDSTLTKHLTELGFDNEEIQTFGEGLSLSMQPSVDAFLEHRSEFMEIGKAAIACELIPRERPEGLRRLDRVEWYEYLFAQLNASSGGFRMNKLAVITFNYDRSFEAFMISALRHSFGVPESDAAEILGGIPIIHVHGQLGVLKCFDREGRPYGPDLDIETLRRCASEIKIIHEAADEDPQFARARECLLAAERVCFLGFGYHLVNIQRLGVLGLDRRCEMRGSAYGFQRAEQEQIRSKMDGRIQLGPSHQVCLDYLRHNVALD